MDKDTEDNKRSAMKGDLEQVKNKKTKKNLISCS